MKADKSYDYSSLYRILKYGSVYKKIFALAIALSLALSVLGSLRPYLTKIAIDDYIIHSKYEGFLEIILIIVAIVIIQALIQYGFIYLANWLGQQVIKDLRVQLFQKILSFKLKYYDKTPVGVLVTRSINDIETIAMIFSDGILVMFGDILRLFVICLVMLLMNWELSVIIFLIIPLVIFATRWFQRRIKLSFQEVRNQVAALNTFAQERLSGMSIVQIFTREKAEYENFRKINQKHKKAHVKTVLYFSIFFPIIDILSSIGLGILIWYGGLKAIGETNLSIGEIIAFIAFIQMLFSPMRQIADKFNQIQAGLVSANRVLKIMDINEFIENNGIYSANGLKGKIEWKNIWFSYIEGEEVLKGLNYTIEPGQNIAIVGSTGAGKSTIIHLMNRFYELKNGQILIDDKDVKEYTLTSLRKNIAIVLQDVFLFSDSILNNITLYLDYEEEEIFQAAREIGIHDFILSLPGGYNFNIKERGMSLSSGQRQLISFLRAYISNPSILILDEATSSVDPNTEELLQNITKKLTKDRTSIIIAHRLVTVQHADKILVMDNGKILEDGSHEELLRKNGVYTKLYEAQFAKNNYL